MFLSTSFDFFSLSVQSRLISRQFPKMELYNIENIFWILKQFLQKLRHNDTWYIEKDDVQEILTIRKKVVESGVSGSVIAAESFSDLRTTEKDALKTLGFGVDEYDELDDDHDNDRLNDEHDWSQNVTSDGLTNVGDISAVESDMKTNVFELTTPLAKVNGLIKVEQETSPLTPVEPEKNCFSDDESREVKDAEEYLQQTEDDTTHSDKGSRNDEADIPAKVNATGRNTMSLETDNEENRYSGLQCSDTSLEPTVKRLRTTVRGNRRMTRQSKSIARTSLNPIAIVDEKNTPSVQPVDDSEQELLKDSKDGITATKFQAKKSKLNNDTCIDANKFPYKNPGSSKKLKKRRKSNQKKNDEDFDPTNPHGETKKKPKAKLEVIRRTKYAGIGRLENGIRIYQCNLCKTDFKSHKHLKKHNVSSHGGSMPTHPCNLCPKIFSDPRDLRVHQDTFHNNGLGDHACKQCERRFSVEQSLIDHQAISHPSDSSKMSKCIFCKAPYKGNREKHYHLTKHHAQQLLHCSFDNCTCYFTVEKNLLQHLKTAHNDTSFLLKCQFCAMDSMTKDSLSYHQDEKHEHETAHFEKPYTCPIGHCRKQFQKESSLKLHTKRHGFRHKTASKPKNALTKQRADGDNQVKKIEDKTEKSPCPTCGRLIPENKMSTHVKSHERRKCDECGKQYASTSKLNSHKMAIHRNLKLFCPHELCAKPFKSRQTLSIHLKYVHENPGVMHQCDQCKKSFAYANDLTIHKKGAHQGFTSQCSFCEKVFVRASERNRHEKQTHGNTQSST